VFSNAPWPLAVRPFCRSVHLRLLTCKLWWPASFFILLLLIYLLALKGGPTFLRFFFVLYDIFTRGHQKIKFEHTFKLNKHIFLRIQMEIGWVGTSYSWCSPAAPGPSPASARLPTPDVSTTVISSFFYVWEFWKCYVKIVLIYLIYYRWLFSMQLCVLLIGQSLLGFHLFNLCFYLYFKLFKETF
jgi:hypothetical protein